MTTTEKNPQEKSPGTNHVSWHLWDDLYHEGSMLRGHIEYVLKHGLEDPQYVEDPNLVDMEFIIENLLELSHRKCRDLWDKARAERGLGPEEDDSPGKEASDA